MIYNVLKKYGFRFVTFTNRTYSYSKQKLQKLKILLIVLSEVCYHNPRFV